MHGSLNMLSTEEVAGRRGRLAISLGQCSVAGAKGVNQDFHGSLIPEGPALVTKGIAVAIADGISSSPVGGRASEIAVKSFLTDYYCTPEAWSVKTAAERVIRASNSWLHSQNGRLLSDEERDRGHVCTFSALILKSRTAHIFHIGDGAILRITDDGVEPMTEAHRVRLSSEETYLARALGANRSVEVDYRSFPARPGDTFLLMTDGLHDHVSAADMAAIIARHPGELDATAGALVQTAIERGSTDDITVQIARVDSLGDGDAGELAGQGQELMPAPLLRAGQIFEGFEILRTIHEGSRSHVYLAREVATGGNVALKVPSTELSEDEDHLRRLMLEEWVARRIDSPHVIGAAGAERSRRHIFSAMNYVEGTSLDQWMRDHPKSDLETVRRIVEQIASGLHAFHRREMLHRDLRPRNVIIDANGTAKIIDFGSAWIAGVAEAGLSGPPEEMLGTIQYSAPEYLLARQGDERSDIFSLGVICYQMLTGQLPFGTRRIERSDRNALRKLRYTPARQHNPDIPEWIDACIAKAVEPDAVRRYEVLSEFLYDLRHPNLHLTTPERPPLFARDPMIRWKLAVALLLAAMAALGWQNHQLASEAIADSNSPTSETSR
jgi:serine/threonine protein kinase/serine/threonine protein phosphatase PrpC